MSEQIDQNFIDTFAEAEQLYKDGNYDESLEKYKTLLQDHPNHISVLNNIGLVYERLDDFEKSIEFYEKCNNLIPNQVIFIHNLANAYTRLEKWVEATPLLEKIIDIDFEREKNAEKYALCLFNTKSKEETKNFTSSAIDKFPDNRLLNRLLGRSLLYLNAHRDGLKYLQKGSGFIEFDADGVNYLN